MSVIFLDTSSLLKLYHHEAGTDEVEKAIADANSIILSELAKVEFNSAVWKNIRSVHTLIYCLLKCNKFKRINHENYP